jgi:hypothetical protein
LDDNNDNGRNDRKLKNSSWVWWLTPVISELRKVREEDTNSSSHCKVLSLKKKEN